VRPEEGKTLPTKSSGKKTPWEYRLESPWPGGAQKGGGGQGKEKEDREQRRGNGPSRVTKGRITPFSDAPKGGGRLKLWSG